MEKSQKSLILAILFTGIMISCSTDKDYQLPKQNNESISNLIKIDDVTGNSITYSILQEDGINLEEISGSSITHEGKNYIILSKFTSTESSLTSRNLSLKDSQKFIIVDDFPEYGDIYISAGVTEYKYGTLNSNGTFSCVGDCYVRSTFKSEIGSPSSIFAIRTGLREPIDEDNIYYCAAGVERYIGSSTNYEPGMWESIDFQAVAEVPPCERAPFGSSTARWDSDLVNNYKLRTFVTCDR